MLYQENPRDLILVGGGRDNRTRKRPYTRTAHDPNTHPSHLGSPCGEVEICSLDERCTAVDKGDDRVDNAIQIVLQPSKFLLGAAERQALPASLCSIAKPLGCGFTKASAYSSSFMGGSWIRGG